MKRITKIKANEQPKTKPKKKVAAYCRVSTASDEQLISLAAQKAHYEKYIKSNPEWEFTGLYYDEGISGTKKEKRDGLLSMIADCEHGRINLIITKSISRFARNTTDCLELVRKLLDLDVFIYFEKENINTESMESELMLSILSGLAESESKSISQNEKWGIKQRFKNGTYIISYPPYGYDNVDGQMVIVPEQAEVVKRIFADILAGKSTHVIARELNAEGIKTKRNKDWTPGTVNGLIKNEKYTGDVIFQKTFTDSSFNRHTNYGEHDQYLYEGHHEPIVSHEIFEKANAIMQQRGKEKGNGQNTFKYMNRYGFSGKIRCGECGSNFKRRMHYKPSGAYVAWCCSRHIDSVQECSMKFVTDDALKTAFLTMMNKLIFSRQMLLKPLLHSLQTASETSRLLQIQKLEEMIEKNAEKRQTLTSLMAGGYLEPAVFKQESNALITNAEMLQQEKDNLVHYVSGDRTKVDELEKLVHFTGKHKLITEYNDDVFLAFVDRVTVISREEVVFELKCGLDLCERLVM